MNTKQLNSNQRNAVFSVGEQEANLVLTKWLDGESVWWLPYLPDLIEEFQTWHRQLAREHACWGDGYEFGDD